jgi:hypothetical protein
MITKGVVKFAIGQQSSIGGDDGTAKLQRQAAVKIEPKGTGFEQPGFRAGVMVAPLRHRQTKEAETDMFDLQPPRKALGQR